MPVDDVIQTWYIDNQQVENGTFKVGDEDFYIITSLDSDKDGKPIIVQNAFTTKEGYIAYGEEQGIKLKEQLDFTTHMCEYAEKTGTIKEYELTGEIPISYTEYEDEY